MMKKIFFILIIPINFLFSQDYFPTNSGVKTKELNYKAFTNATIIISPGNVITNGTLLELEGKIVAIGKDLVLPSNTIIHDKSNQFIYPSFIDLNSNFGLQTPKRRSGSGRSTQYESSRKGYYWNDHILSDYNSINDYKYDNKKAKDLRQIGFGIVNTHRDDGIHRGTSLLVALSDQSSESERLISNKTAEHFSFKKSVTSSQSYPGSVMGAMALIRQFYHDLNWYSQGGLKEKDLAIEAAIKNKNLPKIFLADDKLNTLRAVKVGKEMGLDFAVVASGQDYEHVDELKENNAKLILPLNFPKPYDVSDPLLMKKITLGQLKHWSQAPMNPSVIEKANIPFAITSSKLKSSKEFLSNLRKAISYGLTKKQALASLTTVPAKILNKENIIGTLEKGKLANFIVSSGPLFNNDTKIYENWVMGRPYVVNNSSSIIDIDGSYKFNFGDNVISVEIKNSKSKISAKAQKDSVNLKTKIKYNEGWFYLTLIDEKNKSYAQLNSKINDNSINKGSGVDFNGNKIIWNVELDEAKKSVDNKVKKSNYYDPAPLTYPNKAYGFSKRPVSQNTLFKNATVWTNEPEGILKTTDVLVIDGMIAEVGNIKSNQNYVTIDATGKHLTTGIIDEHSHLGASSINEGGQNSSAEVSIEDVIEPDDIGLYRDLTGGVTTIQILHGSANPIGGRSAIIKLKWGETIDNLLVQDSDPFIKFALGENVKQSNWSSFSRFPQTRMGVEQVFVDYFQRAKEYSKEWSNFNSLSKRQKSKTKRPRYDIEMEVLSEILDGKRFISCHSYVQSEINMLIKVAERFGFRINTFTHILEGYKVADKMADHGVGGSTFSDWWAYKNEVKDAIPYNGAIMHNAGVTVAFNSDDGEMSRRLNQEAAKAVKYGGVSEEEAWKFVTLNPAKLLHLDERIGSIKVGKDADLVLWTDHPMSIYSQAEITMIEGVVYYDSNEISDQIAEIDKEKRILIGQMLIEKQNGSATQAPPSGIKREFHCETLD